MALNDRLEQAARAARAQAFGAVWRRASRGADAHPGLIAAALRFAALTGCASVPPELYAAMCQRRPSRRVEGVEFADPRRARIPRTARVIARLRALLMRCQEEFEKGDGASSGDAEKAITILDAAELKARIAAGEEGRRRRRRGRRARGGRGAPAP